MENWKMRGILVLFVIALLAFPAFAHSGKTDSSGGHNSSSGYHYHHGYPAHSHWDMDRDGDIDCPYDFDDLTGANSGGSYSGSSDGDSLWGSYSSGYKNGYETGHKKGRSEGYESGCVDGYKDGYNQAEADLEEIHKSDLRRARAITAILTAIVVFLITLSLICNVYDNKIIKQKNEHKEQLKKLEKDLLHERNMEVLRRIGSDAKNRIQLPDDVRLDIKCIPIKGKHSAQRPYGDYTIFVSPKGKKYHYRKGCSGAVHFMHLFNRPAGMMPCANCVGSDPEGKALPDWYCQIIGIRPETPKEEPTSAQTCETSIRLTDDVSAAVRFENETMYISAAGIGTLVYYNIPKSAYTSFVTNESPWVFFDQNIKDAYPFYSIPE